MEKKTDGLKYCGLDRLPTSILEEIIRSDLEDEEKYDSELIEYVLSLLAERKREENSEEIPDVQQSWMELQEQLACEGMLEAPIQPLSTERKKTSGRRKKVLRYAAVAAACFAVMCTALITAQAGGLNVFGTAAKWSRGSFHFFDQSGGYTMPVQAHKLNPLRDALEKEELPVALAPTWVPEDYDFVCIELQDMDVLKGVYAVYSSPYENKNITINIYLCRSETILYSMIFEKDNVEPELYIKNERRFYVFPNSGTWTAVWSDTEYGITISGVQSREEILSMIDSIKE